MLSVANKEKAIILLHKETVESERLISVLENNYTVYATCSHRQIPAFIQPDLILIGSDNIEPKFIEDISRKFEDTAIAFFNVEDAKEILCALCIPGVNGMIWRNEKEEIILKGVAELSANELWFPRAILPEVIKFIKLDLKHSVQQIQKLSKKELETLKLLTRGSSNNEIAAIMNISFHTVKTHIYNLYKKLEVKNRAEAVKIAGSFLTSS